MTRERVLAYLAFGTVCTVWGTTYLAIRIAIETLPTFLFSGTRFTLAGIILGAICLGRGDKLPARPRDWGNLALIGVLMLGVGNVAVVWAEQYLTSGFTALIVATSPFWMAIIESLRRNGERMNLRKALGMAIGFGGVAILVAPELAPDSGFNRGFILGVLVLQIGSICWNLGTVRSKYHPIQSTPLMSAAVQMFAGGVVVTLIGLALGETSSFHFNTRTFIAYLYLLLFGSILAYGAFVYALSKLRTSTVMLYAYINPAVAVLLGWAILDEPLGWRAIVAMLVILGGVAMVQTAKRGAPLQQKTTEEAAA